MISWFMGMLLWSLWIIPIVIGVLCIFKSNNDRILEVGIVFLIIGVVLLVATPLMWHYTVEVNSVNEKIVTVGDWQPKPGISKNDNGFMVIDSAGDLLMVTSDGEGFLNEDNFLFGKFNSRDILNNAKPGSVLKVKYYGWREGFNNGFPNILSVEVIDDSNATSLDYSNYLGNRIVV